MKNKKKETVLKKVDSVHINSKVTAYFVKASKVDYDCDVVTENNFQLRIYDKQNLLEIKRVNI